MEVPDHEEDFQETHQQSEGHLVASKRNDNAFKDNQNVPQDNERLLKDSQGTLREKQGTLQDSQVTILEDKDSLQHNVDEKRPDIMLATVAAWKKEKVYSTKSIRAVKDMILSKHCVCVMGYPGAGKSTALYQAALSLEKETFTVYFITGLEEFLTYFDMKKKQVFVLNDALGVHSVSQSKVDLWQEHNEKIINALGAKTKLLVSIRTQIFNTISNKGFVFLEESSITGHVNFSDYEIGVDEMRGMLRHYMTVKDIDSDVINKVIGQLWPYTETVLKQRKIGDRHFHTSQYTCTVGEKFSNYFPLLCKVFVNTDLVTHDQQKQESFFNNPFRALVKVFANIKSDNKDQFCALVLCAVFDGKLNDDMFSSTHDHEIETDKHDKELSEDRELRDVIIKSLGFEEKGYLHKIKTALISLSGSFLSKIEGSYTMSHTVFHDIVTYLYDDPLVVFRYGKSEFIRDRIRINTVPAEQNPYVIVYNDDTNIERLVDRLLKDLESNSVTGAEFIANNPNIHDDKLISFLKRKLFDKGQTDKTLIDELFRQSLLAVCRNSEAYTDVNQNKLIALCVSSGADCNMYIRALGRFPLHISVWNGDVNLTKLLLQHGADARRVVWFDGYSILHWVCRFAKCNSLELIKLITTHMESRGDLSVVKFITSDRHRILQELRWYSDILQLEEVLERSIKVLTNDEGEIKQHLKLHSGQFQLVRHIDDNILTYIDRQDRNILHYSIDDIEVTKYLLDLSDAQKDLLVKQKDKRGHTPFWYVKNDEHPSLGKAKSKNKKEMESLYDDKNAAIL